MDAEKEVHGLFILKCRKQLLTFVVCYFHEMPINLHWNKKIYLIIGKHQEWFSTDEKAKGKTDKTKQTKNQRCRFKSMEWKEKKYFRNREISDRERQLQIALENQTLNSQLHNFFCYTNVCIVCSHRQEEENKFSFFLCSN